MDTHRSSRINQCLAPPRDPLSRAAIIIACNFISAFRDRIVKIDGGTGIGGIRNEGYYRRIRGNFTIHIFFPLGVDSPRRFSFINLLIFNVYDPTNGAIGNRVFFRVKISPISLRRCEKIKSIVDPFRKIFIEFRSSSIYLSFDWMENIDRHISRRRLITGV